MTLIYSFENCVCSSSFPLSFKFLASSQQHCVKSVHIRSYSGPHFHAFGLNTKRSSVSLCIQSKCRKIQIRITPNTDTFQAVIWLPILPFQGQCSTSIHFCMSPKIFVTSKPAGEHDTYLWFRKLRTCFQFTTKLQVSSFILAALRKTVIS